MSRLIPRINTRWFLDRPHVIKKIGDGKARALRKVGAMVYRSCQGQFASGRPNRVGSNRLVGQFRGLPLIERRTRTVRPGRITSWRTPRNPNGFMRSAMGFAYDPQSQSVVIGPRRAGWLNEMQERGGTQIQRLYIRNRGRPIPVQKAYGLRRRGRRFNLAYVGTYMSPRPQNSSFVATARTRAVRNRPGRFQQMGLDRVRDKIPARFKGQIYGP